MGGSSCIALIPVSINTILLLHRRNTQTPTHSKLSSSVSQTVPATTSYSLSISISYTLFLLCFSCSVNCHPSKAGMVSIIVGIMVNTISLLALPSVVYLLWCLVSKAWVWAWSTSRTLPTEAQRKLPLPPGSMGYPYIGETFQLYSKNPNIFFALKQKRLVVGGREENRNNRESSLLITLLKNKNKNNMYYILQIRSHLQDAHPGVPLCDAIQPGGGQVCAGDESAVV